MAVLHIADYVIFALSIVASFAIGIYYACKKDKNISTEDYLVASRKMNVIPVAISLLVSILSAIALLGTSSEIYYFGIEGMLTMVAYAIGATVTSFTFVPLFHGLKLTSVHEYVFLRYQSRGMVYICSFLQNMTFCLVNGMAMYAAAMVTDSMAGIPIRICMLVTGVVATIYTTIGGYQAVVWCDVFQAVIILIGIIVIDVLGIIEVGGISQIFQIYHEHGRTNVNFSPYERNTFWGFTFGFGFTVITMYGILQTVAQRYMSLKTLTQAKCTVYYTILQNILITSLTGFSGIVAFSYYAKLGCDPLASKQMFDPNQIIPYFIRDVLHYPCVGGIFIACIFCATLANLSSTLNSVAAMIWDDVLKHKLASRNLSDKRKSLIAKIIAFCAGIISTVCAFIVSEIGGTLIEITVIIVSASLAPVVIIIVLGAVSPNTSWKSALIGSVLGTSLVLWMSTGHTLAHIPPQMKPLVTTNCTTNMEGVTHVLNQTTDLTYIPVYSESSVFINVSVTDSTPQQSVTPKSKQIFGLYRVSFVWYFPAGFTVGLLLGIILSFIPGLRNTREIESNLFFPFVTYLLRKQGYFSLRAKQPGLYTEDCKDKELKEDLFTN